MTRRSSVMLGLVVGAVFGIWNLIATRLDPLADDTPGALLLFYGPMFLTWAIAGFVAARRTGHVTDGVKTGATVAFATFVVFVIAVLVRVNLFLDVITQRSDWQNLMLRFQRSEFETLRAYVNYVGLIGAPFKLLVATTVGALMGLIGGIVGRLVHPRGAFRVAASLAILLVPPLAVPAAARAQVQAGRSSASPVTRDSVIARVLAALDSSYVFPDKARAMRAHVQRQRDAGVYPEMERGSELANALTIDLQSVSHDKHLRVWHADGLRRPPADSARPRLGMSDDSCFYARGLCTSWVFPGNVGYVEIRSFGVPTELLAGDLAKAMTNVANTDALIIDIRRNGGGSPHAVRLVSSYLFGEEPVHLNSIYWRPDNRTDDFYTIRYVEGKRFGPDKPIYVLTSSRTFSAAEEFAYNLQSRKRAIIVGETTGGGAHPGGVHELGAQFAVFVPSGRAINPVTKGNWEGTGVRPDVATRADSALDVALSRARKKR